MKKSTNENHKSNTFPIVEIEDLSIQWGKNNVLNQLNLAMNSEERIAIVGPSGCGKSTILRIIAGLQLPSSGVLRLFGDNQIFLRSDQTNPPDVRMVFQNPALIGSLTVEENVGFILKQHTNIQPIEIKKIVHHCLSEVGLFDVANKLPSQLSGGMQKRVSFARALITDQKNFKATTTTPLLLFDEPTAGLDPMASTKIEDLIVQTTKFAKGCSIVVSHVMSTIERCSERVLILYGGKFRWDGSVKDFKESDDPYIKQFRTGSLKGPMQPKEI